jgi:hypothetical protein
LKLRRHLELKREHMRPNEQSVLRESDNHSASPEDLVLSFMRGLGPAVTPLGFLVALKFKIEILCWKLLVEFNVNSSLNDFSCMIVTLRCLNVHAAMLKELFCLIPSHN